MSIKYNAKNILRKNMISKPLMIPRSNIKNITSFDGPFDLRANINAIGNYDNFRYDDKFIYFDYVSAIAAGNCSSKFFTTHDDGTKTEYFLNMKIRDNQKPSYSKEFFVEFFRENFSNININTELLNDENDINILPTKLDVFETDINLSIESNKTTLTNEEKSCTIVLKNNSKFLTNATFSNIKSNKINAADNAITSININVEDGESNKTNYACIRLYNYINKESFASVQKEKYIYIKLNDRTFDVEFEDDKPNTIDPFPDFDNPSSFINGNVEYPKPPDDENIGSKPIPNICGDLFKNTLAHAEKLKDGTSTLKIGKTVPSESVNLAYYYNKTSSYENALSVVETNTNSITIKRKEIWEHKARVKEKDESIFSEYITFNGEKDTPLEGYYGVLYRDYVSWDEIVDLDKEPKYIKVIETFQGLTEKRVPMEKDIEDKEKKGKLKLTHTVFEATRFYRDKTPRTWNCFAIYEGYVRLNSELYNGSAKFSGTITKKDGMSNLDPEQPREILLYPNDLGVLEDSNGNSDIDDDLFLITDKFKDGEPLYYKHKLKYKLYSSNNSKNTTINVVLENNSPIISKKYKYLPVLKPTGTKNIYDCYIYTNFLSSSSAPIYAIYQGITKEGFNFTGDINSSGIKEKLSLYESIDSDEYEVLVKEGLTKKSKIVMNEFSKIEDIRKKIKIKFFIECEGKRSRVYEKYVLNKKYSTQIESSNFINDNMIISPKNNNGFLTAKDILFLDLSENEKTEILNNKKAIYKVLLDLSDSDTVNSENKLSIFTSTSGSSFVYAKTYMDTGLLNENDNDSFNKLLDDSSVFISKNGYLYKGYSVKCKNVNQIVIEAPNEKSQFKGWYPKIKYSYFSKVYERIDKTIRLIYSVPEFNTQIFGKYGKPYIDVDKEIVRKIGEHSIKLKNKNIYLKVSSFWTPDNLIVYKKVGDTLKKLTVSSYYSSEGIVEIIEKISDNDVILCDYTYEERFYKYRGYYEDGNKNSEIINLNLNPNIYSTYIDTVNEFYRKRPSYELFNRTIHFFLKPMRVIDEETGKVEENNRFCVYHKFDDNKTNGPFDLHIGRIFMRHYASLKSTELIDTRNRGGGILESISNNLRRELEPDSDFYLDISTFDGEPYQENSVIVVRLDKNILKINGGNFTEDEVLDRINKWKSYGSYVIVDYVSVIDEKDNPTNTIKVKREFLNDFDFCPYFTIEEMNE